LCDLLKNTVGIRLVKRNSCTTSTDFPSVNIADLTGSIIAPTGDWYDRPAYGERHITLFSEESAPGTSLLYIRPDSKRKPRNMYVPNQTYSVIPDCRFQIPWVLHDWAERLRTSLKRLTKTKKDFYCDSEP